MDRPRAVDSPVSFASDDGAEANDYRRQSRRAYELLRAPLRCLVFVHEFGKRRFDFFFDLPCPFAGDASCGDEDETPKGRESSGPVEYVGRALNVHFIQFRRGRAKSGIRGSVDDGFNTGGVDHGIVQGWIAYVALKAE